MSGSAPRPAPLALVAGGSRGLGLAIALDLGRRGHRLVICARSADELATAETMLRTAGVDVARAAVCDVSDAAAVENLVQSVEREDGPIEVAFAVAGVIQVGPLASMTRAHFDEAIAIMLWGPINVALAVSGPMRERGHGRIGIITSIAGLVSVPHLLPYSTAKFGAVGFSSGLRAELAGTGVKVTTVAPGLMRTGSHLHATFTGHQAAEYAWFAPSATLPGIAMTPERAAVKIVNGVLAGRAFVLLSLMTKAAARVSGLAPTTTAAALGLAARLLPSGPPPSGTDTVRGFTVEDRLGRVPTALAHAVTVFGRRAARRLNQQTPLD